ncbi:MAG: hypothetical protein JWO42_552 [Chloroflexi bacterium]|jgi:hypothetical protein|nr:hypothetical protein [Chloroflexota bacterium]
MTLFNRKAEAEAKARALREERGASVEQRIRLYLIMGYDIGAARYLLTELHNDPDPLFTTCRRAIELYKLDRFQSATHVLRRELQRSSLDNAVCEKYALLLTDIGVLTPTDTGYEVIQDEANHLDEQVAEIIDHLQADQLLDAQQEAERVERERVGRRTGLRARMTSGDAGE